MGFLKKALSIRQLPFMLLTAAVVVWLICLPLFQDGMFIDGIQYAAVARNLAMGIGTFWNPVLAQNSVGGLNTFHEHPPLVFFIQSLFFKLFGFSNIYPERIYCLFTFLLTALFTALIWRKIFKGQQAGQLWWLPVLLWTIMPVVFWSFANNIQENTMGVFTTASVYFFLCAVTADSVLLSKEFYSGCICVLLAGFSKGVPGLFPLTFFFIYWLTVKKINLRAAITYSLCAVAFLAIVVWAVLQNHTAKEALHVWLFDRMLKRIATDPVETSHFHILIGLFTEQLPAIVAVVLSLIIFSFKQIHNNISKNHVVLFLLLGLSASLPLMLTLVQRDFYFTPALPLFAIAWALLIVDGLNTAIQKLDSMPGMRNALAGFAVLALLAGVAATVIKSGQIKRDHEMLHDVYAIQKQVPQNTFVSVTSDVMWMDWSFRCYMMRYNSISFSNKDTCRYFISLNANVADSVFADTKLPLQRYHLYERK